MTLMHHHAYLTRGVSEEESVAFAIDALGARREQVVQATTLQNFGVGDARALIERALKKPLHGDKQYFVIRFATMTREAQNALLKLLEDPTGESVFVFITAQPDILLPTLRSRMEVVQRNTSYKNAGEEAQMFLKATTAERIALIGDLLPKKNEEKDLHCVDAFLHALERELAEKKNVRGIKAVHRARRYLFDRGAMHKMLLEQVALLT